MNEHYWGAIVYGLWFLCWVGLEISGWRGWAPWPSLSQEAWWLEKISYGAMTLVFLFGLATLTVHIVGRWPK